MPFTKAAATPEQNIIVHIIVLTPFPGSNF